MMKKELPKEIDMNILPLLRKTRPFMYQLEPGDLLVSDGTLDKFPKDSVVTVRKTFSGDLYAMNETSEHFFEDYCVVGTEEVLGFYWFD